jgi:membrane-associated phospholipid phosphatase
MSNEPVRERGGTVSRRSAIELIVSGAAILVIVGCGFLVKNPAWTAGEFAVLQAFSDAHSRALDAVALTINWLFAPLGASIVAVLVAAIVLLVTRSWRRAATFLLLVVVPWLGCQAIKVIVERPRPDVAQLSHPLVQAPHSFSYPSGHTVIFAALGLAAILVTRPPLARSALTLVTGVGVTIVAWSRIYLGVHYPSDVFAAIAYAVPAVTIVRIGIDRWMWPTPGWTTGRWD